MTKINDRWTDPKGVVLVISREDAAMLQDALVAYRERAQQNAAQCVGIGLEDSAACWRQTAVKAGDLLARVHMA